MITTDLIGYTTTAYYLYNKVNAKFNPENKPLFKAALITAFVAADLISYYTISQVDAYLKSEEALKTIVQQLPTSYDETLETFEPKWAQPSLHHSLQCLYLNRIIMSLGLSFFSTQKLQSSAIITSQCASLVGTSQFNQIQFVNKLMDLDFKEYLFPASSLKNWFTTRCYALAEIGCLLSGMNALPNLFARKI